MQADAARRRNNIGEAEALLRRAIALDPKGKRANEALGDLLLEQGHNQEAMTSYEAVLAGFPADKVAQDGERRAAVSLALAARNAGEHEKALRYLERARTFIPHDLALLTDIGIQAQAMHRLRVAADALAEALKIAPSDPKALYAAARVEMDQERFADADLHLRAYLAQRPDDASAHYGLGHLLQMQLRTDDARKEFERSIALQPVQTESYYQLGQMALDAGSDEEARAMFAKTLDRMPTHGGALTGMGILAYRGKKFEIARDSLLAAVQSSPQYQPAHYYLGLTLKRLGDIDGSARELKIAEELASEQQGKGKPIQQER